MDNAERISDYLDGNMSKAERRQFEDDLERDAQLHSDFELLKQAEASVKARQDIEEVLSDENLESARQDAMRAVEEAKDSKDREAVRAYINRALISRAFEDEPLKSEDSSKEPEAPRSKARGVIWISTLALAASLVAFLMLRPASMEERCDSLYKEFFEIMPSITYTNRAEIADTDRSFIQSVKDYNNGDFEKALPGYEMQAPGDEFYEEGIYFIAQCYAGLGETEKAITQLNYYLENHRIFIIEANWYLAMLYIEVGEYELAKQHFELLEKWQVEYYEKSIKRFLRTLKKVSSTKEAAASQSK